MIAGTGQFVLMLMHDVGASLHALGKRSVLAVLGIAIGSSSVVAMINIGSNAATDASMIFNAMGVDTLVVQLSDTPEYGALSSTFDSHRIRNVMPSLLSIAPTTQTGGSVILNGRTVDADLIGSTSELAQALDLTLREGRFLSDFDKDETFAIVGHELAEALNGKEGPLQVGDRLRINRYLFQVIGILQKKPDLMFIPIRVNESIFLPLEGMIRLNASTQIRDVIVRVKPHQDMSAVALALGDMLKKMLGAKEASVLVPQQIIDGMSHQNRTFAYLLMALGGISLVGGGAGVMNVMLMNVSERRREIGVRMALGARRRDIRNLFMLEALTLTTVGALCGGAIGITFALIYANLSGWKFFLAPVSLPLGLTSTLMVGLFFGLYPAILASRLQPVEALRDE
ncbi:ABC transporter permease [Pseudomonas sp. XS1P51]